MRADCETVPPDGRRITLAGELTLSHAGKLRDLLADHLAAADRLTLDLSGVGAADLTAAQLLIAAGRKARELGKTLELAGPPGQALQELGEVAGLLGPAGTADPDAWRRLLG